MTERIAVGLFITCLVVTSISGLAQALIVFQMADDVNRKRGVGEELDPLAISWQPHTRWIRVLREYRSLYPNGRLVKLGFVAIVAALLSGIGMLVLLFGVLPHWASPPR
ncbi:MAG TPA: hypothetical protein VMD29_10095 [Terracidiphilus sp.]|nr:hypothetical protein [Terracidiphilus sp.]